MFIQVKQSKYYVMALYTDCKGGFNAEIEHSEGKASFILNYSNITGKFYKNGKNAKLPIFLCKEILGLAISKGLVFLDKVEIENTLYYLKNK